MGNKTAQPLIIYTLGGLRISIGDKPLTGLVSQKKSEALMVYLACNPIAHSRQVLANLFWGDYQEDRALNNLSVLISNIKKQIGDNLVISRHNIGINPKSNYWIDVQEFSHKTKDVAHLADFVNIPNAVPNSVDLEQLSEANDLYKGKFLDKFLLPHAADFETWISIEQERYQALAISALKQLLQNHHEKANYAEGIKLAHKTLELDPLNENANHQLIYMLALQGQRNKALAAFESFRKLLLEEIGLEPISETTQLAEEIRQGTIEQASSSTLYSPNMVSATASPPIGHPEISADTKAAPQNMNIHQVVSRLEPIPSQHLFGIGTASSHLYQALSTQSHPWLVAIYGMGGLGKTTLANKVTRDFIATGHFSDIAWVSAKQEEFLVGDGISDTGRAALDSESLVSNLFEQLSPSENLNATPQEKLTALKQKLSATPHLVIVDNLETAKDIQEIIPLIRELSNPTKFLITSRFALNNHRDVYGYNLNELNQEDTLALLRYEATSQGIHALANATEEQLLQIFEVVGGNPLALNLVIGQLSFLPLKEVLSSLVEAKGKRVDAMYTYMYWQAWNMLDEQGKQLFLSMPIVQNGTFSQLSVASMLESDDLQSSLANLISLSLVRVSGDLEEPRYNLHRLTETFLMNEVLKWQALA